jgi:hypothetical protein
MLDIKGKGPRAASSDVLNWVNIALGVNELSSTFFRLITQLEPTEVGVFSLEYLFLLICCYVCGCSALGLAGAESHGSWLVMAQAKTQL